MYPWFSALLVCQRWWPQNVNDRDQLSAAIAKGNISILKSPPLHKIIEILPSNMQNLIFETTYRIGSPLKCILDSAKNLSLLKPTEASEQEIWAERHFLAGFAENRIGDSERTKSLELRFIN